MNFIIDTDHRKVMTSLSPGPDRHIIEYKAGSPVDYAVRTVEKLIKIHLKMSRTNTTMVERTR